MSFGKRKLTLDYGTPEPETTPSESTESETSSVSAPLTPSHKGETPTRGILAKGYDKPSGNTPRTSDTLPHSPSSKAEAQLLSRPCHQQVMMKMKHVQRSLEFLDLM